MKGWIEPLIEYILSALEDQKFLDSTIETCDDADVIDLLLAIRDELVFDPKKFETLRQRLEETGDLTTSKLFEVLINYRLILAIQNTNIPTKETSYFVRYIFELATDLQSIGDLLPISSNLYFLLGNHFLLIGRYFQALECYQHSNSVLTKFYDERQSCFTKLKDKILNNYVYTAINLNEFGLADKPCSELIDLREKNLQTEIRQEKRLARSRKYIRLAIRN